MILTGSEILKQHEAGRLTIDPFDPAAVGPNSYDVTLAPEVLWYVDSASGGKPLLDARRPTPTEGGRMPEGGFTLVAGRLYLASTVERVGSDCYVTYLDGRSSVGRLGLQIHMTAGRGDLGFAGRWTLELLPAVDVIVYPGMRIGQATFHAVQGEVGGRLYRGKYGSDPAEGATASRLWRDFAGDGDGDGDEKERRR